MTTRIEALPNTAQWICARRAIEQIFLCDEGGQVVCSGGIPWLVGRLDDGTLVNVVGMLKIKKPLIVDDLKEATYELMRPVLLRGIDEYDEEIITSMYLPLSRQQLSPGIKKGEFLLETSLLVAPIRIEVDQERTKVGRVTILHMSTP